MNRLIIFISFSLFFHSLIFCQHKLKIIGVNKILHQIEPDLKYKEAHTKDLSSRYQIFVQNVSSSAISSDQIKTIYLNDQLPTTLHQKGNLSWFQFPEQDKNFPQEIPAHALMVWQFNGKNNDWLKSDGIHLKSGSMDSGAQKNILSVPTLIDTIIRNEDQKVFIESIVFTGSKESLTPNQSTIHLFNESNEDLRIKDILIWQSLKYGSTFTSHASILSNSNWQFLYSGNPKIPSQLFQDDGILHAHDKSIIQFKAEDLQLGLAAVQIKMQKSDGSEKQIWAYIKIKKEQFDISAGWANYPIKSKPGFLNEYFLKTLKSLYINTAHYYGQPGYSDNEELFSKYPLKYFGHLVPWQQFDKDSLLHRLHGIEILGEPQYGGGKPVDPQTVCMELLPYAPSRIPTTLTHSEERIWRFYAGLSDYPHYDAYRVSAPSADEWENYDRWKGEKIAWGAPLETIGTMTRSLKLLNRPAPIAYWSQGPHEGWEVYGGRKLTSPTSSELRLQAYHALSSGITSLYWFNLSYASLNKYSNLMEPMQRIGREIRLLDSFYIHGNQWAFETIRSNANPQWDLSTFIAPQGILLFAMDLDYIADTKSKTFIFTPNKIAKLNFKIPEWVGNDWKLLKLDHNGLHKINYNRKNNQLIELQDSVTEVGIYVFVPSDKSVAQLQYKWQQLLMEERKWDFNPAQNNKHKLFFNQLDD